MFKVRPNPAADDPVAENAPTATAQVIAADPSFMLINDISQLSENYDLVESVASSLFDQISLPRR